MSDIIKRKGWNTCDACGREFNTGTGYDYDWTCPHCGFENQVGQEFANNAQRIAVQRSRDAARRRLEAKR